MFLVHLLSVIVPLVLFIAALSLNNWAEIDDLLVANTHLEYGLFQVCGYDSYPPELNATQDCYPYNSNSIPPALKRTNHLAEVWGCEDCDHRRKVSIAFTILPILCLVAAAIMACAETNCSDDNGEEAVPASVSILCLFAGVLGVIGFATWIVLIRFDYNKDRKWIELSNARSQPDLEDSTGVHMAAAAWVCAIICGVIAGSVDAHSVAVCGKKEKRRFAAPQQQKSPEEDLELEYRRAAALQSPTSEPPTATTSLETGGAATERTPHDKHEPSYSSSTEGSSDEDTGSLRGSVSLDQPPPYAAVASEQPPESMA